MKAIRQFIDVKNNSINVVLPKGFTSKMVGVIILPTNEKDLISGWHKEIVMERIENLQTPEDAFKMIAQMENDEF